MLILFTLVIVAAVTYAHFSEGFFTAGLMFCNVLIAGLVAFNFFEPLADGLQSLLGGSFLEPYADFLSLVVLFSIALGALRWATNSLSPTAIEYNGLLQSIGGAVFGVLTGYLAAGFLCCAVQTLPLHENFLGFNAAAAPGDLARMYMPPDRVWLSLMSRAGAYALSNETDLSPPAETEVPDSNYRRNITFDKYGTFEARYARYRRYGDNRGPLPYGGELNQQMHK